jgi:hypothetical protein
MQNTSLSQQNRDKCVAPPKYRESWRCYIFRCTVRFFPQNTEKIKKLTLDFQYLYSFSVEIHAWRKTGKCCSMSPSKRIKNICTHHLATASNQTSTHCGTLQWKILDLCFCLVLVFLRFVRVYVLFGVVFCSVFVFLVVFCNSVVYIILGCLCCLGGCVTY